MQSNTLIHYDTYQTGIESEQACHNVTTMKKNRCCRSTLRYLRKVHSSFFLCINEGVSESYLRASRGTSLDSFVSFHVAVSAMYCRVLSTFAGKLALVWPGFNPSYFGIFGLNDANVVKCPNNIQSSNP